MTVCITACANIINQSVKYLVVDDLVSSNTAQPKYLGHNVKKCELKPRNIKFTRRSLLLQRADEAVAQQQTEQPAAVLLGQLLNAKHN